MTKIQPFSQEELSALAAKLQAECGGDFRLTPLGLLEALSAHVLARHLPEHEALFLSRQRSDIEKTFALEMLKLHGLPDTQWLDEEEQEKFYGGDAVLSLFDRLTDELLARYAGLASRRKSAEELLVDQDAEV